MEIDTIENLQKLINELTKVEVSSLVRSKQLGEQFDFRDLSEEFGQIIELFKKLQNVKFDKIPIQIGDELFNFGLNIKALFEKIKTFNPQMTDAAQQRNILLRDIKDYHTQLFKFLTPILSYFALDKASLASFEKEANDKISAIENSRTQMDGKLKEADDVLKQIKDSAGKFGVARYAVLFKDEADSHQKNARTWLWVTGGFAAGTIIFGILIFLYYLYEAPIFTLSQTIQLGIAKLVIFAVLYFGVVWSGRIYKAQQHNFVVNQHRHNALNTFETFVKATEDKDTKNAVLIKATESIFSPQHTGFSTLESEPSASPKILEIISAIGRTKE